VLGNSRAVLLSYKLPGRRVCLRQSIVKENLQSRIKMRVLSLANDRGVGIAHVVVLRAQRLLRKICLGINPLEVMSRFICVA
jgi:hypothetical protein